MEDARLSASTLLHLLHLGKVLTLPGTQHPHPLQGRESYIQESGLHTCATSPFLAWLSSQSGLGAGTTVCDEGCGQGRIWGGWEGGWLRQGWARTRQVWEIWRQSRGLISGSVRERNGQKRGWTALSMTSSAQPGSLDSSNGDVLEASGWDLMKVTFDENSCLGRLSFRSFTRREESQHCCRAPAKGGETLPLSISSTGTYNAKESRGPSGASCSEDHQDCTLCLPTLLKNCSLAAHGWKREVRVASLEQRQSEAARHMPRRLTPLGWLTV